MDTVRDLLERFANALFANRLTVKSLADFLVDLLLVLLIVTITLFVGRRVKSWSARIMGRSRVNPNVINLAGNAAFVVTILLGLSWLLSLFGADWTAIVASLSVITVAIGLSVQDVLRNLVAGVYLLLEQPFKIGDEIAVKGITGAVEGIDIRTTVLRTDDGLQVLVPNSLVFTEVVTNRSAYNTRRVSLQLTEVTTSFKDLNHLVNEALRDFEDIDHTPAPRVTIKSVNNGASTLTVEYWQRGSAPILPAVLARLKETFPEADITVTATGDAPVAS